MEGIMKKTIRILIAMLLAVTLLFTFAGCTNSSPKAVVKACIGAMNKGNVDKMIKCFYFSSETEKGIAKDTLSVLFSDDDDSESKVTIKISELKVTEKTDESATVEGKLKSTYTDKDGNEQSSESTTVFKCVKKDGKWYLTYNPIDWI